MSIKLIRKKKEQLESKISELLTTFTEENGLNVDSISLTDIKDIGKVIAISYQVHINATL